MVADPADRTKVFGWKLTGRPTRSATASSTSMSAMLSSRWAAPLGPALSASEIRYVDYRRTARRRFLVSVTFVYETYEDRPDPFSEYRSGFEIRTRKRCTRIEIRTHADADRLVRTYELIYLDQRDDGSSHSSTSAETASRCSARSRSSATTGSDGGAAAAGVRLHAFEPDGRNSSRVQRADLPARSLASPDLELVDLFGNGLPDSWR